MAHQQARLLELRENSIDRRQSDIQALGKQLLVNVFGGQVPDFARLEKIDDLEPWQRRLQSGVLEVVLSGHERLAEAMGAKIAGGALL